MKSKDQLLLEQAYQSILEHNELAMRKKQGPVQDPEILRKMADHLWGVQSSEDAKDSQDKPPTRPPAKFYATIHGLKSEEEEWSSEKSTSKYIEPGSLLKVLYDIPSAVKEIEQGGYDWTRVFISTHEVMNPTHVNIGRTAQLGDITNTVTLINNRTHILVRAYDPYGVRPSKEMRIEKDSKTNIHNALMKAEDLLMSLYQ